MGYRHAIKTDLATPNFPQFGNSGRTYQQSGASRLKTLVIGGYPKTYSVCGEISDTSGKLGLQIPRLRMGHNVLKSYIN